MKHHGIKKIKSTEQVTKITMDLRGLIKSVPKCLFCYFFYKEKDHDSDHDYFPLFWKNYDYYHHTKSFSFYAKTAAFSFIKSALLKIFTDFLLTFD